MTHPGLPQELRLVKSFYTAVYISPGWWNYVAEATPLFRNHFKNSAYTTFVLTGIQHYICINEHGIIIIRNYTDGNCILAEGSSVKKSRLRLGTQTCAFADLLIMHMTWQQWQSGHQSSWGSPSGWGRDGQASSTQSRLWTCKVCQSTNHSKMTCATCGCKRTWSDLVQGQKPPQQRTKPPAAAGSSGTNGNQSPSVPPPLAPGQSL